MEVDVMRGDCPIISSVLKETYGTSSALSKVLAEPKVAATTSNCTNEWPKLNDQLLEERPDIEF